MFLVNNSCGNLVGQTYMRLEEVGLLAHKSETICVWHFPEYRFID